MTNMNQRYNLSLISLGVQILIIEYHHLYFLLFSFSILVIFFQKILKFCPIIKLYLWSIILVLVLIYWYFVKFKRLLSFTYQSLLNCNGLFIIWYKVILGYDWYFFFFLVLLVDMIRNPLIILWIWFLILLNSL